MLASHDGVDAGLCDRVLAYARHGGQDDLGVPRAFFSCVWREEQLQVRPNELGA